MDLNGHTLIAVVCVWVAIAAGALCGSYHERRMVIKELADRGIIQYIVDEKTGYTLIVYKNTMETPKW